MIFICWWSFETLPETCFYLRINRPQFTYKAALDVHVVIPGVDYGNIFMTGIIFGQLNGYDIIFGQLNGYITDLRALQNRCNT